MDFFFSCDPFSNIFCLRLPPHTIGFPSKKPGQSKWKLSWSLPCILMTGHLFLRKVLRMGGNSHWGLATLGRASHSAVVGHLRPAGCWLATSWYKWFVIEVYNFGEVWRCPWTMFFNIFFVFLMWFKVLIFSSLECIPNHRQPRPSRFCNLPTLPRCNTFRRRQSY